MEKQVALRKELADHIEIGAEYEHYSGKRYKVIALGHHTEDLEPLVIYESLYDDVHFGKKPIWARPIAMWVETITIDGKLQPRFRKVS